MRRVATAAAVLALALAGPAVSQDAADDATLVEELIVTPPTPGPAWWRVSDADTTIYVMVVPVETPKALAWDRSVLDRRMKGASRLILPFRPSIGPVAVVKAVGLIGQVRTRTSLQQTLPPAARDALIAGAGAAGKPVSEYEHWIPYFAAGQIEDDYRARRGLVRGAVLAAIEASAKANRVPSVRGSTPSMGKVKINSAAMPGADCLIAEIETMAGRAEASEEAARRWAGGDVRPLVRPPAKGWMPAVCNPEQSTNAVSLRAGVLADYVKTFEQTLKTPGHAVAVIGPGELLTRGGVLERLRAKGYRIGTPAILDD